MQSFDNSESSKTKAESDKFSVIPPKKISTKPQLNDPYCIFDNKYPSILAASKITAHANLTIATDKNINSHTLQCSQHHACTSPIFNTPPDTAPVRKSVNLRGDKTLPPIRPPSNGTLTRFPLELARPSMAHVTQSMAESITRLATMRAQPAMLPRVHFGAFANAEHEVTDCKNVTECDGTRPDARMQRKKTERRKISTLDGWVVPRKIGRRRRLTVRPRRDEEAPRISSTAELMPPHPSIAMAGALTSPPSAPVDSSTSTSGPQPRPNVPECVHPGACNTVTSDEAKPVANLPTKVPATPHVQTPWGEVELGLVLDGRAVPDHNSTNRECYIWAERRIEKLIKQYHENKQARLVAQIRWDLACQSRADGGESAAPRRDKQTTEGTKGNGLEKNEAQQETMLLIQDSVTDEVLQTTYNSAEAATVSTPDVKRPTTATTTKPMTLRQKLLARSTEITVKPARMQPPVTQQPPVPRPSAARKRSVAWGEALEDEWQTVPTRHAAPRSVWEPTYPRTRNRFSPLDDGDEMVKGDDDSLVRRLPQTTAKSSGRRKPARAKKAGKEPPPPVLLLEGLPGAVSTRIATEETETSAPRMRRRLRPDPHRPRFTGCDGPVSQRMPQQPIDAANTNGTSLWVHTDARKRQHRFACHSEWPTPRESCTGRGLGGDDARGQAALKTGDMARARRGSRHKTETVDGDSSDDGCGLDADRTANAQRESSSGKTTSSATRVHGGTGRRTGSTARAGAQRGTQHGPDTVVAGCDEDCRELEADRMAADSVESRHGLAARDEASDHGGTGRRFGGTARARVTNHGAKVLEVTAGDSASQLAEGACQATRHDPGVLRVAGGNRGSKLGSGGSARASRASDGGITERSQRHCDRGPETGVGGRSELETDNDEHTRDKDLAGTETRGTSGGGERKQGLGVTTGRRRGIQHSGGEQLAAGIGSKRILGKDCSARAHRDSGSGTGTRRVVRGGGGPEATVSVTSGQQEISTGRAAGDNHRPEPETSEEIRRHGEARNGTGTMGKAADTGSSALRTSGSVGPLVSSEATGQLGSPSCRARDTDPEHAHRRPVSVRGVRHLLAGQAGFLSDRLFVSATACSAEQATKSEAREASASARVQPGQSPSETDDDSDMNTVTLPVEVGGARVLVKVRRSECLYSECPGWGSAGTARAIGLALRRAQGQPEAGIRSVDYCLEHKSAPHDAGPADWNSLVRFVETGGSCRARERRPTRAG